MNLKPSETFQKIKLANEKAASGFASSSFLINARNRAVLYAIKTEAFQQPAIVAAARRKRST
jgi:hypothetical protein